MKTQFQPVKPGQAREIRAGIAVKSPQERGLATKSPVSIPTNGSDGVFRHGKPAKRKTLVNNTFITS